MPAAVGVAVAGDVVVGVVRVAAPLAADVAAAVGVGVVEMGMKVGAGVGVEVRAGAGEDAGAAPRRGASCQSGTAREGATGADWRRGEGEPEDEEEVLGGMEGMVSMVLGRAETAAEVWASISIARSAFSSALRELISSSFPPAAGCPTEPPADSPAPLLVAAAGLVAVGVAEDGSGVGGTVEADPEAEGVPAFVGCGGVFKCG